MTYRFQVRHHPLGVVVVVAPGQVGELLIPGEQCCGMSVAELQHIADTTGIMEVDDATVRNCPLLARHSFVRNRPAAS